MLSSELQQKLIEETINSAICIDNEYVGAYAKSGDTDKVEKSRQLYESFRDSGSCHLDIYTFTGKEVYDRDKEKILRNRDLVILDWELDDLKPCKYEDALSILDDVCMNDQIHFVEIYTQEIDLNKIALTIYSYFKLQKKDGLLPHVKTIIDPLKELFNSYELEGFDAKYAEVLARDFLSGFILNPSKRKEIFKEYISQLEDTFQKSGGDDKDFKKRVCIFFNAALKEDNYFKDTLEFFKAYCICYLCELEKVSTSKMMAKAVNPTTVLVEGTFIHVTSKRNITPKNLFSDLVDATLGMPNRRSLLLSLILKQVVSRNLASFGKPLGKIGEATLLTHCDSLKEAGVPEENVRNFIVSALTEHVMYSFQTGESEFSFTDLIELEKGENISTSEKIRLIEFNSMLTFIPKSKIAAPQHQIKTGDVFVLNNIIQGTDDHGKSHDYKYLICISPSCDALRPYKINNNLAFALGELIDVNKDLNDAETEFYSFIPDDIVVKWSKRFLTIYIAETKLSLEDRERKFKFHYKDNDFTASFLGTQKESYTYRITNNVFSHAMRIGIDLPHK